MNDQHLVILRKLGDRRERLARIVVAIPVTAGSTVSVLMFPHNNV